MISAQAQADRNGNETRQNGGRHGEEDGPIKMAACRGALWVASKTCRLLQEHRHADRNGNGCQKKKKKKMKRKKKLVDALSPVSRIGLYQGYQKKEDSGLKKNWARNRLFVFVLFIFVCATSKLDSYED